MDLIQGELRAAKICDLPLIVKVVNIAKGQFLYCPKCKGLKEVKVINFKFAQFVDCGTCETTLIQSPVLDCAFDEGLCV